MSLTAAGLSLGSNIEPERHLAAALAALRARFGAIRVSAVYRNRAVGFDGPDFLNAAVVIDSDLDAHTLDDWLHALEDAHGRDRSGPRFSSRTLDVDLVLFGDLVLDGSERPPTARGRVLRLPRPDLHLPFVLRPLAEIAPDMVDPASGLRLAELWAGSADRGDGMEAVTLEPMAQG